MRRSNSPSAKGHAPGNDTRNFRNASLCGVDGTPFIRNLTASDDYKALNRDAKDENTRVYADTELISVFLHNV